MQAVPGDWVALVRAHQWLKNLLVFVPLFTAHAYGDGGAIAQALACFIAFSLIASATYIVNDLVDIEHDRAHALKQHRPLAAGKIPTRQAGFVAAGGLLAGLILAAVMSLALLATLVTYIAVTLSYSYYLKKLLVVDVFVLAILYTLRLVAGAVAIDVALSFWLLAFSIFLFLSLAYLKRYVEIRLSSSGDELPGRSYRADDIDMVTTSGVAAGFVAALVFALYINSDTSMTYYRHPEYLWGMCLVIIFWINRTWMLARRGEVPEDPVLFTVRDPVSLICAVIAICSFWLAR